MKLERGAMVREARPRWRRGSRPAGTCGSSSRPMAAPTRTGSPDSLLQVYPFYVGNATGQYKDALFLRRMRLRFSSAHGGREVREAARKSGCDHDGQLWTSLCVSLGEAEEEGISGRPRHNGTKPAAKGEPFSGKYSAGGTPQPEADGMRSQPCGDSAFPAPFQGEGRPDYRQAAPENPARPLQLPFWRTSVRETWYARCLLPGAFGESFDCRSERRFCPLSLYTAVLQTGREAGCPKWGCGQKKRRSASRTHVCGGCRQTRWQASLRREQKSCAPGTKRRHPKSYDFGCLWYG